MNEVFAKIVFATVEDWRAVFAACLTNQSANWVFGEGGFGIPVVLAQTQITGNHVEMLEQLSPTITGWEDREYDSFRDSSPCCSMIRKETLEETRKHLAKTDRYPLFWSDPPAPPFICFGFSFLCISRDYQVQVYREGCLTCAQYSDPVCQALCDAIFDYMKPRFGRVRRPSTGETCYVGPKAYDILQSGMPIRDGNFRHAFKLQGLKPPKVPVSG